ncbi:MAG: hypothetical protein KDA92_24405, partial [Planctomycetales bacterium]|nr:hypothetical protein [Planctomycetales bacterium]
MDFIKLIGRVIAGLPFTVIMVTSVTAAAIWTGTHVGELHPTTRDDIGFAPLHLMRGEYSRLLSSVFFTVGGAKFYASSVMLALCVGATERLYGSLRTAALFWGIHLATLVVTSI